MQSIGCFLLYPYLTLFLFQLVSDAIQILRNLLGGRGGSPKDYIGIQGGGGGPKGAKKGLHNFLMFPYLYQENTLSKTLEKKQNS